MMAQKEHSTCHVITITAMPARKSTSKNTISIQGLFQGLQTQMIDEFKTTGLIGHPGAQGQAGEDQWLHWFERHLPERYRVAKAFVVDSRGNRSDEIDVVVYDRQYSPLLFHQGG